jgi:hypothetical protein
VIHSLNEWLLEVWGFTHAGRIFSTPIVTLMDIDMAVAELEFCLENGARTVLVRPAPVPGYRGSRSFGLPEFDPFWARVAEAGIFVSMHASDSGYDRIARMWQGGSEFRPFEPDPFKLMLGFSSRAISDSIAALICHGVFARHPKVRVASIENGCNWVRGLLLGLRLDLRRGSLRLLGLGLGLGLRLRLRERRRLLRQHLRDLRRRRRGRRRRFRHPVVGLDRKQDWEWQCTDRRAGWDRSCPGERHQQSA